MSTQYQLVQYLTDELKMLVGWGARPKRVITLSTLWWVAGVAEEAGHTAAGRIICNFIMDSIETLPDGPYSFKGRMYSGQVLMRCFELLLSEKAVKLRGVVPRRIRVMKLLGRKTSVDSLRRPDSEERELLLILATWMVERREDDNEAAVSA